MVRAKEESNNKYLELKNPELPITLRKSGRGTGESRSEKKREKFTRIGSMNVFSDPSCRQATHVINLEVYC